MPEALEKNKQVAKLILWTWVEFECFTLQCFILVLFTSVCRDSPELVILYFSFQSEGLKTSLQLLGTN